MKPLAHASGDPAQILARAIENDRVHSGYLLTGAGPETSSTALAFVRALVCERGSGIACEACGNCRKSNDQSAAGGAATAIVIDGKGKRGPTYRHVADHPDLLWVERGRDDTRITVGQIRDLQSARVSASR